MLRQVLFSPCSYVFSRFSLFLLNLIVYSSHARNVSIRFDCSCVETMSTQHESRVMVQANTSGKAVKGAYCWWKPGYRDLLSYVTFLLDMWPVLC